MVISKSSYKLYKQCPKLLWLKLNKPELEVVDASIQKHIDDGKQVGNLAKQYFKNVIDVTSYDENGNLDIENMIGLTNRYLSNEEVTIAEATFSVNGLFCSVDLLVPSGDGYDIYEVKASTGIKKEHYYDVAFQRYVLQKRGLKVNGVYILHLNNGYIRHGDIDVQQLFVKDEVSCHPDYLIALSNMEVDISDINNILLNKNEPEVLLSSGCKGCPFKEYCHKDIVTPSVLDINGLQGYDYLNRGIVSFDDVVNEHVKLNKRQQLQVNAYLFNKEVTVDNKALKKFLDGIRYPIYHLDFESIELAVPPCDGAWPYEQIPTQYSLHIEYEDGTLEHKEFLGNSIDPRREIAESLCRDIPMGSCVMAYFKGFECSRLKELADMFSDLSDHLLDIADNVIDLIVPFKSGAYYHINMGGSNSIKAVLPALCPNDPELDYHVLPVVHKGDEAMAIYPIMLESSSSEKKRIRDGLLKYCCLDTLAMVKVLGVLKNAVKEK